MSKSKAYRATKVKDVSLERVLQNGPAGAVSVGLDVGKEEIYAVLRWNDGTFERPWKALNPSEIPALVERLRKVGASRSLTAAMESTGTYGDALRARLGQAGVGLNRVSGKAAGRVGEGQPDAAASPLLKPDVQISRIRLPQRDSSQGIMDWPCDQ